MTAHRDTKTNNNDNNKIPVDHDWLKKLLSKHGHDHQPALVLAPMVDQSDLPFRLLCRKYGTNLCFTPMIHAKLFATSPKYRKIFQLKHFEGDRPLIAQLCGSELDHMLYTAQAVAPFCDGIDINCGCPQSIAKRGMYGAFLLEEEEKLLKCVKHLLKHLEIPLSVKVRLLPSETRDESVRQSLCLYEKLVDVGIHMLTVHGRTRLHKGTATGHADWDAIRQVVEHFQHRIPILANGSMANHDEIRQCLTITGADGVMCSEAILEYPPLFYNFSTTAKSTLNPRISKLQLCKEYLQLCEKYPPDKNGQGSGLKCMRVHIHRFLHYDLQVRTDLRAQLVDTKKPHELHTIVNKFETSYDDELSWYYRHRTAIKLPEHLSPSKVLSERRKQDERARRKLLLENDPDEKDGCMVCLFD